MVVCLDDVGLLSDSVQHRCAFHTKCPFVKKCALFKMGNEKITSLLMNYSKVVALLDNKLTENKM